MNKRQSFIKKAAQTSSWYVRLIAFALVTVMGFSFALYPIKSEASQTVSARAFDGELALSDYKAVAECPTVKNINAEYPSLSKAELKNLKLYPGGIPFGIKFITEGVLIVGFCDVENQNKRINPSSLAGLKMGDRIISIDGKRLNSAEELTRLVEESEGRTLNIIYTREGKEQKTALTPIFSENEGAYKTGIYVKDSGAGIGTVSYINPKTLSFGGLGHGICEGESGQLIPISKGSVVDVNISGVVRGEVGDPGELKGYFSSGKIGSLYTNNNCGVFGSLDALPSNLPSEALSIGLKKELRNGKAYIYTTIEGKAPRKYEIEISNIKIQETQGKCFSVRVTDKTLLEETGGILQGMGV